MNELTTVNFHGNALLVLKKDGVKLVAMKPIVESIGLNWSAQFRRIKRDDILSTSIAVMATEVCANGQLGETVALPIEYLNGWLFGIDSRRVKPEVKEKLFQYKKECYKVLDAYFNKGVAVNRKLLKELKTQIKNQHESLSEFSNENFEQQVKIENLVGDLETCKDKINRLEREQWNRFMLENMVIECAEYNRFSFIEVWKLLCGRLKKQYSYIDIPNLVRTTGGYALAIEQSNLLRPAFEIIRQLLPRKQIAYLQGG